MSGFLNECTQKQVKKKKILKDRRHFIVNLCINNENALPSLYTLQITRERRFINFESH